MNILVTGGSGFIGRNFIEYMLNKYPTYHFVNYDILTYAGNIDNVKEFEHEENYSFVQGDINNKELLCYVIKKQRIDTIINFAAESHVDRSISNPDIFVKTNVLGTQVLLDVARTLNIEKYIQISTDEVYGSLGEEGLFTELSPLSPNSPYSATKASADLLVRAYYETYHLNVNITRCSNNYGPFQFPEKLIPLMVNNSLNNKKLPVYGHGNNIRDWLHVYDHCSAIDLVLHGGKPGEVYNIGGNNEKKNIDVVKEILSYLNKPIDLIEYIKDRPGHDQRYAIDATKIKRDLGWGPVYSFKSGLYETINWYVQNMDWLNRIKSGQNHTSL
jgi:dTDP-glucose 4,6-dehydratase